MGMFDYIKCEAPLPDGFDGTTGALQTKDFNCEMCTHVITADGRLILERVDEWQEVPKAERPFPDAADDDFLSLAGSVRTIKSKHDANWHGWVYFYAGDDHDYRAKFTDGNLVEIEQVKD